MEVAGYIAGVNALVRRGAVGEHSIRSVFIPQLRNVFRNVEAINEPGATDHGNPDISVYRSGVLVGRVGTKSLATDLDDFERTDQFDRYIRGFANLLVTNFNEFRLYIGHDRRPTRVAMIGRYLAGQGLVIADDPAVAERAPRLLETFCSSESPEARTAAELAQNLATFAISIREMVSGILSRRDDDVQIRQELEAFRAVLIPDLSEADFADMYAQTVTYGLFAARCAHPNVLEFDRISAPQLLPLSNPFLRNVFGNIAGINLDVRIAQFVDQICLFLRTSDVNTIVAQFKRRSGIADPVVHFYETFLETYDRGTRRDRGVYYTPLAVVSFIVRSADLALRRELHVPDGLADAMRIVRDGRQAHRVQVLDPATGTGTFLLYLIDFLKLQFTNQAGLWGPYVHEELLPKIYGFEILMAPYAIAHLKVGMGLTGEGFEFHQHERLNIYLTNTLEDTALAIEQLPFQTFLTVEAREANEIKQQRPIMVVIGNPPYSVRTSNLGPNARRLVSRYTVLDGHPIREGGTLALQRSVENDYVKFIAFAQEQIERNGEGIVGYITANGYLDQPTLAGLRRSLMQSFDDIRIVDLHGYARAGSADENVFTQIGEGVAVLILVRRAGDHNREATVSYHSCRGMRAEKRGWLAEQNAFDIDYEPVHPVAPDYRFRPESAAVRERYRQEFIGLTEIFQLQRGAIVTARDSFAIGFTEDRVLERLEAYRDHPGSARQASEELGIRWSGDWPRMAPGAKAWLRQTPNLRQYIKPITYRPFDDRYVIYSDQFLDTPSVAVMDHVVNGRGANRLLLFGRSVRYGMPDQFFVTAQLAEAKSGEASRQCHAAPFFLYHDGFAAEPQPNVRTSFIERVHELWGERLKSQAIFGYVYAMLNSNVLREEFAQQLCADYARIPMCPPEIAEQVGILGQRLVNLHIGVEIPALMTGFPIAAPRTVLREMRPDRRWQSSEDGWNLYLNNEQFISGIPDVVRTARIAGYPVLDKWLSWRVDEQLSVAEVTHLQRVVSALEASIDIVMQVDDLVAEIIRPA